MKFLALNRLFDNSKIPFTKMRFGYFIFSLIIILASIFCISTKGMNFGLDFKGGILLEIKTHKVANLHNIRTDLSTLGLDGSINVQQFSAPDDILIRLQNQNGGEKAQQIAIAKVKEKLSPIVSQYRRVEAIGATVSSELLRNGIEAVSLALVAILIYVWVRFEWQFAVAAIIALCHDVITTLGLFSITGLEFNLTTVAAVLTIAGYSINDTVVVFDRVREDLRKYKKMPIPDLLDLSINQTLSRTIITALTTFIAVFALLVLGGDLIHGFSVAMVWGLIIGTYSSICVAVPLLIQMKLRHKDPKKEKEKEKDYSAEETFANRHK